MVRRSVAAGVGIVVLLLVVLLFRGCLSSRKENAMREYVQRRLGRWCASPTRRAGNLFRTLTAPADAQRRGDPEPAQHLPRARASSCWSAPRRWTRPDDLKGAQSYLDRDAEVPP